MKPTLATLLAAAARATQNHAEALEGHRAAHAAEAAHRAAQAPPASIPAPRPGAR